MVSQWSGAPAAGVRGAGRWCAAQRVCASWSTWCNRVLSHTTAELACVFAAVRTAQAHSLRALGSRTPCCALCADPCFVRCSSSPGVNAATLSRSKKPGRCLRVTRIFSETLTLLNRPYPNGPWVAMKASSALWSQPAPCGGLELQRRACLLTERYVCAISAHGVARCAP